MKLRPARAEPGRENNSDKIMLTAAHFKERLNQTPFKPFRIHMTGGKALEVPNHDAAMITRSALEVGVDIDESAIAGRIVECAIIHIVRIEDISQTRAAA